MFAGNKLVDYYFIASVAHIRETKEDSTKREMFEEAGVQYEFEPLSIIHKFVLES